MKEPATFVNGPEIRGAILPGLEHEILSVGRPFAAAFVGSIAPAGEQEMKVGAVGRSLPDRAVVGFPIVHRETQNRTIRRPADIAGGASGLKEQPRIASIAIGKEDRIRFAISDALSVRRPDSGVAFQIAQSTRRAAEHGDAPKRAVERSAQRGIHQQRGTVARNVEEIREASVLK